MSGAPLRWGVLGATSLIARNAVLPAIRDSQGSALVAVASRTAQAADAAAVEWAATSAHRDYQAMIEDRDVEAVYIPLPTSLHREWVERCALAGKHVLCEKPLGQTLAEVESMIDACARAGVVLVEACMTPHHPRTRKLEDLIASGGLGRVRAVHSAFRFPLDPANHRWQASMGGGALLDVGIYCLLGVVAAFGAEPRSVHARSVWRGDVDASTTAWLDYGEGCSAVIDVSFDSPEQQLLELVGDHAAVRVATPHTPRPEDRGLELRLRDGTLEHHDTGAANCYQLMVEDMAGAVRDGGTPRFDTSRSLELARLLALIREAAAAD